MASLLMHDPGAFTIVAMSDAAELGKSPRVSNECGVKVTVILQSISSEARTWDFEVTLETHTQELSDDLSKSAVLVADGKKYMPVGWEGAQPGAHRKSKLRFKAIASRPASVELQIRLAGDSAPGNFKWLLK